MAEVLVTGGTGMLGRHLVPKLVADGHRVRVLSRHTQPGERDGVVGCRGDILTGAGIADAVAGTDVVIHAATNARRRIRKTEVTGATNVAAAAVENDAHLIYVSIVGVDNHRYLYYRAKHAAEQVIANSGARWTALRATQFFDLVELFLSRGWFIRTPNLRFQPIAAAEVAGRLVELAAQPPQGLAADFGGPEVLSIRQLAATRDRITGSRTRMLPVPRLGFLADFDAGRHLTPEHRDGTQTWEQWLTARL